MAAEELAVFATDLRRKSKVVTVLPDRLRHRPWHTAARRAAGSQLLDGPKATYEVASAIGADASNTGRLLRTLRDEDRAVDDAGTDRDGRPRYALAAGHEARLLSAIAAEQPTGMLVRGQVVLVVTVKPSQEATLARALRSTVLTAEAVWAARIEGIGQYMLVFDREAKRLSALTASEALRAAGLRVRVLTLHEVMTAESLRREMATLRLACRRASATPG